MSDRMKKELIIWLQCFVVSTIAAIVSYDVFEFRCRVGQVVDSGADFTAGEANINAYEMLGRMWNDYFGWYLGVFFALTLIKFSLLFLFERFQKKIK